MQLTKENNKFDRKKVEAFLRNENKFITDIFSFTLIPERNEPTESDEETERPHFKKVTLNMNKTTRARSLGELQQRLQAITSKKKLTYKEKLTKKSIKNRIKKKNFQDERNAKKKLQRAAKLSQKEINDEEMAIKTENNATEVSKQPIFNKEDKIVFSKIDFSNVGNNKVVKKVKDPKKILQKMEHEKQKLEMLKEIGEFEKATVIKEKSVWKNALAKAEGQKVKDDPLLLKKSLKKQEQKKKSSKKKWEQRIKGVEKTKSEKQKKRLENIQKRKKDKKTKKLKKAAQKGKIIPGL